MFWRLLNDLGLWIDDEYLARKEARTVIYDKREIIPRCVIRVSEYYCTLHVSVFIYVPFLYLM